MSYCGLKKTSPTKKNLVLSTVFVLDSWNLGAFTELADVFWLNFEPFHFPCKQSGTGSILSGEGEKKTKYKLFKPVEKGPE